MMDIKRKMAADQMASVEFCRQLYEKIAGRARVWINSQMTGFDQKDNTVFVHGYGRDQRTIWMPASKVMDFLSDDELEVLNNLPEWNGCNEYILNLIILGAIKGAIECYRHIANPETWTLDLIVCRAEEAQKNGNSSIQYPRWASNRLNEIERVRQEAAEFAM